MLHIVLLILKIIGMILGILLAVLLAAFCIALFVPVRYRVEARRSEAEGAPPVEAEGSVTWLFHLVNIRFRYPAEVYLRARIFLFTVFRLPPKQKAQGNRRSGTKKKDGNGENKRRGADRKAEEKNERCGAGRNAEGEKERNEAGRKVKEEKEREGTGQRAEGEKEREGTGQKAEEKNGQWEIRRDAAEGKARHEAGKEVQGEENGGNNHEAGRNAESEAGGGQDAASARSKSPKRSIIEKIKAILVRIREIFQNIWYTLTGICDKMKTIWENIEYYRSVLQSDAFQKAFALCKAELFSIFSYIRPRKLQADLTIGMDDPASVGKILSYYGMLYPFIGGHVNIEPDFDRKRLEGFVLIKGKVRLFTFVKAAVRIYFSKDIRKLLRLFKKEDV